MYDPISLLPPSPIPPQSLLTATIVTPYTSKPHGSYQCCCFESPFSSFIAISPGSREIYIEVPQHDYRPGVISSSLPRLSDIVKRATIHLAGGYICTYNVPALLPRYQIGPNDIQAKDLSAFQPPSLCLSVYELPLLSLHWLSCRQLYTLPLVP